MLLPNKLFSYNESVLSKLPLILRCLTVPRTPKELLIMNHNAISPSDLLEILDCLYTLKKIYLTEEGKIQKC